MSTSFVSSECHIIHTEAMHAQGSRLLLLEVMVRIVIMAERELVFFSSPRTCNPGIDILAV